MHRKYCYEGHQKRAWNDHKTICNVYKELKLASNTYPVHTVSTLFLHSEDLLFGRDMRLELAPRVNIEALELSKHFGLKEDHNMGLVLMSITFKRLEKFEGAEIFASDAVEFARDELHDIKRETAAGLLAKVPLSATKAPDAIELCDRYLEFYGTEDPSLFRI
jgi:hypothetical protein